MLIWIAVALAGAGRLDWVRGWVCAAVYAGVMSLTGLLVRRFNPGLLSARAKGIGKDTPLFDRIFLSIFLPLTFIQGMVAGLDAVRFRAMPLPGWTMLPGIALFVAAMALVTWTLVVNPFAESTVRIQADRSQTVIDTGPYRLVRHPMYVGIILMYPATALMFGSGWALGVAALMAYLVIWRTAREDRFLQSELQGYREFAARTRYRLIPGIW